MDANGRTGINRATKPEYDRKSELTAFDNTQADVKGLVDAAITKLPRIFIRPPDDSNASNPTDSELNFPIVDLCGIENDPAKRKKTVERICNAAETWGFFQVINHGIPYSVLEEILTGVRRYQQETGVKKQWYTRQYGTKSFAYNSMFDLYSGKVTNWRDSFCCVMAPNPPSPEELPSACSYILIKYSNDVMNLGYTLFELLSEALGLDPNHLKDLDCAKGLTMWCHYYPACPEPELTIRAGKHADNDFLTVLFQDITGGLQVLHQNQWVDVPPTTGTLVVNIGDLLQLISNDKFISVEHRVLANHVGPRV